MGSSAKHSQVSLDLLCVTNSFRELSAYQGIMQCLDFKASLKFTSICLESGLEFRLAGRKQSRFILTRELLDGMGATKNSPSRQWEGQSFQSKQRQVKAMVLSKSLESCFNLACAHLGWKDAIFSELTSLQNSEKFLTWQAKKSFLVSN